MKKKNKLISMLSVFLTILLIISSTNVISTTNEKGENIKVNINKVKETSESIEITKKIYMDLNSIQPTNIPITSAPEDEFYPTIGIASDGALGFAYTVQTDFFTSEIPWFYSTDDGNTWEGGLVWIIEGIQTGPTIAYTGSDRYFVASLQDPINGDGANQWLLNYVDISDTDTWEGSMWSWADSYPYRDRGIPDIAGYDLVDAPVTWNHLTICIGTRDERVNMPIFNYLNYDEDGSGWSSYHDTFQGCENSAIDIDQTNGYFYTVVDHYNETRGDWDLILINGDCHPTADRSLHYFDWTTMGETKNTKSPDVGANGGTVMIVAEQDELIPGKNDIVCYYSSDNSTWDMSIVAGDTADDEVNPTIVVYGDSATCTYAIGDNLYSCHTIDGGATWADHEQINSQDSSFVNERRNSAITNGGYTFWTDSRNGNNDIYYDNIGFPPAAVIEISDITGGIGVSATLTNIGGADATNLDWSIDVEGGFILLGHKEGTISTLAPGSSQTIKLPLVIGLGASTITVEAGGVQQQADCKVLLFFVTGIE